MAEGGSFLSSGVGEPSRRAFLALERRLDETQAALSTDITDHIADADPHSQYAFRNASPTITLSGAATGSVTLTNLGNGTLTVAVTDDSHNHTIANVDNLQATLDGKAASSHSHSYLPLTGGTLSGNLVFSGDQYIQFEGSSADAYETILRATNPTADRTIYLPNANGTLSLDGHTHSYAATSHSHSYLALSGGTVTGNITAQGDLYIGKDGGGDSNAFFYDDNSNTWRTLQWDDSVNDWRVEDNGGTMRTLYHSGNIPSYAASSHTHSYAATSHTHSYLSTSGGTVSGDLTVTGHVYSEGPDGGGVMRYWQAGNTYVMFGTKNMASEEYAVLTDGINTYIGAGTGGTTHIRGPNNDSSPQITNNGTNVNITGTVILDIVSLGNEIQGGNGSASDPTYTFTSDQDVGVYRVTTNQLGLTAGNSTGCIVASGTVVTASPSTGTTSGYQYVLRNNTYGTLYRYTSTIDVKEQVTTFDDAGSIIDALRPVTFIPKFIAGQPTPDDEIDEFDPTVETEEQRIMREADLQYGFIAEEVAQAGDGKLAQYEWTEDGQLKANGWKWPDMIAVLTAEVKSLRARVATLEAA